MIKKIVCLTLCLLLAVSAFACKPASEKPQDVDELIKETDIPLVSDGQSDYKIVIPSDPNPSEEYAAEELRFFINESTGAALEIVSDEGLSFDSNAKYLSVGKTALLEGSGLSAEYSLLNSDGYKIKTFGNTVIMTGAKDNGTLYSAYGFLERNFDYEYFAIDEWSIKKADTVMLLDMDVTDIPTFNGRWITCQTLSPSNMDEWVYRARLTGGQGKMLEKAITPWSILNDQSMVGQILPYEIYGNRTTADGKPWMTGNMKTGQLCITTATYDEECFNTFTDNLINNFIAKEKEQKIFMLGINDHNAYCKCDTCLADYAKYKQSGVMVRFCNKVADRVQEWIDRFDPGREFYICMFAYLYTLDSPTSYDTAQNKYLPLDNSVICNDNVMVRIAPISSVNMYPHSDMEHNGSAAVAFASWKAVASNLSVWDYGTNFNAYLAPYPDWGTMQENFKMYKEIGVSDILTQTPAHTSGTAFYAMTIYLRSQLMWDAYQDFDGLVNNFIDNYYKTAAKEIREYYDYLRSVFEILKEKGVYDGNIYGKALYSTCWTYDNMLQIERIFDRAFAANEAVKESDPDTYELVNYRLTTESLFYRFVIIANYSSYYPRSTVEEMINSFESDAKKANLTGVGREVANNPSSNDLLSNIISGWRSTLI